MSALKYWDSGTSTWKTVAGAAAGIPAGGATSQLLSKIDGTDYNVQWVTPTGGGNVTNSGTPTAGQIASWVDATHIQGIANTMLQWDGGATGLTASTGRTSLGATATGSTLFTLVAGGTASYLRLTSGGGILQDDYTTVKTNLSLDNVTNDAQTKASIVQNTVPSDGDIMVGSGTNNKYLKRQLFASGWATSFSVLENGAVQVSDIFNSALANSAITIGGVLTSLGGSALSNVTNDAQTKAAIVGNAVPGDGDILVGSAANSKYLKRQLFASGWATSFGVTENGAVQVSGIFNSALANSAISIAGTSVSLGGTIALGPTKVTWYKTAVTGATHTVAAGCRAILVEVVAGGGGGGGALASVNNASGGSGGGGGGYAATYQASPAGSYSYTVGAGGNNGGAGGGSGTAGGNSSFGTSFCAATGGALGAGDTSALATPAFMQAGGAGGVGSVGDFTAAGGDGDNSFRVNGTVSCSGAGGGSIWAGMARGVSGAPATGTAGNFPGGGGAGGSSRSATGAVGGTGAVGAIRVTEFF